MDEERPLAHGERLDEALDETAMDVVGALARSVLKHAEAVNDDIDAMLREQASEHGGFECGDGTFDVSVLKACLLRFREPARHWQDR